MQNKYLNEEGNYKDDFDAPVNLRPGVECDHTFIIDSWIRSWFSRWQRDCGYEVFFKMSNPYIKIMLARSKILVACDTNDPSTIFGYIVYEVFEDVPIIHYVFTKSVFRKLGIARVLYNTVIPNGVIPMASSKASGWEKFKHYKVIFNPFIATRLIQSDLDVAVRK